MDNTFFILKLINNATPKINSKTTTKMAINREKPPIVGKLKTAGEKYSSSLKENPITSMAFTKPDAIKISATIILKIDFM